MHDVIQLKFGFSVGYAHFGQSRDGEDCVVEFIVTLDVKRDILTGRELKEHRRKIMSASYPYLVIRNHALRFVG